MRLCPTHTTSSSFPAGSTQRAQCTTPSFECGPGQEKVDKECKREWLVGPLGGWIEGAKVKTPIVLCDG